MSKLLKHEEFEKLCAYRTKYEFYYPNKNGIKKRGILYFFDDEIPEDISRFLENYDNVREFGTLNLLWHLQKYNKKALHDGLFENEGEVVYNVVFVSNSNLN
jgi:hypothetical protein